MKIFLTEYQEEDTIYAGLNIFAESFEEAESIADIHGLIIVGEITEIVYQPEFAKNDYLATIKMPTEKKILH
tara:strand:+ start:962 stop:1177 length:216 start_codon:yes stop_codon:yes gene_type:complete